MIGKTIGPYHVIEKLGEGGMGEVYRARDTRLERVVALKVLPPSLATDPDRRARFEREAKTLATLNHQHIAQVYGIEEAGGQHALAMEFVDGEDLATRLTRGPIPFDEARLLALQTAEALEAAHEHGVIHRDLKPANIAITRDGHVKVLDFGLAKLIATESAAPDGAPNSPTITTPAMTQAGVILGTAAYMSPEQAKGRPLDRRTDIWAFGCVLYEMLTGRRAFEGEDVLDTLSAITRADPDWNALPGDVPPSTRSLLQRCLEKDRRERVPDMAVARFELRQPRSVGAPNRAKASSLPQRTWPMVAAAVVSAVIVGPLAWYLTRAPVPATPQRVTFLIPALLGFGTNDRLVSISRDGRHVAYLTSRGIAVRTLAKLEPVELPSLVSGAGSRAPEISPDGQWIAAVQSGVLVKIPLSGGAAIPITAPQGAARGMTWTLDNHVVFAGTGQGLMRVSATGGTPEPLTTPAVGETHFWPSILPNNRAVLFSLHPSNSEERTIATVDLATRQVRQLPLRGSHPQYVSSGHIIYLSGTSLNAVPFNADRLQLLGEPVPILQGVSWSGSGSAHFSVSDTGTLAYIPADAYTPARSLVWINRSGQEDLIKAPARPFVYPRISPDQTRVALEVRDRETDLWIWDLIREVLTRLTFDPAEENYPTWSPDGRFIYFGYSSGGRLARQPANGAGKPEPVTQAVNAVPQSMAPNGTELIVRLNPSSLDVGRMLLDKDGQIEPLLTSSFNESNADVSPDGRWIAYQSSESGTVEIYVRPYPSVNDGRWQVSSGGGSRPVWSKTGKELFYLDAAGYLTTALVKLDTNFTNGAPSRVLPQVYFSGVPGRTYDVSADGSRFLMIKESPTTNATGVVVILNWLEEVKEKVKPK